MAIKLQKKRIGIDLRHLPTDGSVGAGIAHASRALVETLVARSTEVEWTLFLSEGAEWGWEEGIVRLKNTSSFELRRALRSQHCHLLFSPAGSIPPLLGIPAVPWVHDLSIFSHPEWFPESPWRRLATTSVFRMGVKRSPVVTTVSDFTATSLALEFGIAPTRIRITGEGGDRILGELTGPALVAAKQGAKMSLAAQGMTNPIILWMGTVEPRKNVPLLLKAWRLAIEKFSQPVDLIIAGKQGWKMEHLEKHFRQPFHFPSEGGSRLHRLEVVDEAMRRTLLLAADVVALPSFEEGFGLVALEAQQAATAVIVSKAGALPEVVGSQGVTLDPSDIGMWTKALIELFRDESSRHELAQIGKSWSQHQTWEKTADLVYSALTQALG